MEASGVQVALVRVVRLRVGVEEVPDPASPGGFGFISDEAGKTQTLRFEVGR
jgi:hypothetical protein